jgi:hypothetical protein
MITDFTKAIWRNKKTNRLYQVIGIVINANNAYKNTPPAGQEYVYRSFGNSYAILDHIYYRRGVEEFHEKFVEMEK